MKNCFKINCLILLFQTISINNNEFETIKNVKLVVITLNPKFNFPLNHKYLKNKSTNFTANAKCCSNIIVKQ